MSRCALSVLSEIREKLQSTFNTSELNVILMTDNFTSWKPTHAKCDVLLHYSSLEARNAKVDELVVDVYLFVRNYAKSATDGVFYYTDKTRTALDKCRPVNGLGKLIYESTVFQEEKNGIWCYKQQYSITIPVPSNV